MFYCEAVGNMRGRSLQTLMLILILSVNNKQLNIFSLTAIRASFYSRNDAITLLSDVSEIRGK